MRIADIIRQGSGVQLAYITIKGTGDRLAGIIIKVRTENTIKGSG